MVEAYLRITIQYLKLTSQRIENVHAIPGLPHCRAKVTVLQDHSQLIWRIP